MSDSDSDSPVSPGTIPSSEIPRLLATAQQLISTGEPGGLKGAAELTHRAILQLNEKPLGNVDLWHRQLAAAWIIHGHALREMRNPAMRTAAIKAYDEALAHLDKVPNILNDEERHDRANLWTNRGRAFLEENTPDSLKEAVRCFGEAVALRRELPLDANPSYRWGLTASLMNRGDGLTRMAQPELFPEALQCYDEAIAHLRQLPFDEHGGTRSRLAIALMNRGITWQCHATPEGAAEAVRAFEDCMALLREASAAEDSEHDGILACALMNHGNSLLSCEPPVAMQARDSAREAVNMVANSEREDPTSGEVGIKGRHLLCRVLAFMLDHPPAGGPVSQDWVTEATDAADEGMELARHWNQQGVTYFQPLAGDLFRFGSRIYQVSQPHFLAEFLLDSLDPDRSPGAPVRDPYMFHIAGESLWNAVVEIEKAVPRASDPEQREALLEVLGELQAAEARLRELREKHLGAPSPAPASEESPTLMA
jgi:tetratricopeptide (TPR) repeat protein